MNIYNIVQALLHTFENTNDQKPIDDFRLFLACYPGITKWVIASDYCIGDKQNQYDCFSFTLFPYDELPTTTFNYIRSKLPKDIKKVKELPKDAVSFFHEPRRFYVSIVIDRKRNLFISDSNGTALDKARVHIKSDLQRAIKNNYSLETRQRLRKLVEKSEAKSFSLKLYENIILLASFYIFISVLFLKECKIEKIGWFSDRDKMISYCDNVIWDFAKSSFYIISDAMGLNTTGDEILIAGHKEAPEIKEMWYDELIRPADYLSSSLSSWSISADGKLHIPNTKQGELLRHAIAGNRNIVVLHPLLKDPEIFPLVARVNFSSLGLLTKKLLSVLIKIDILFKD